MDNGKKHRPALSNASINIDMKFDVEKGLQLQCNYPINFAVLDVVMILETAKNTLLAQLYQESAEINKVTIGHLQKEKKLLTQKSQIIH